MGDGHKEFVIMLVGAIAATANACVPTFSGCEASRTCAPAEGGTSATGGDADGSTGLRNAASGGTRNTGDADLAAGASGLDGGAGGADAGASDGGQPAGRSDSSDSDATSGDSAGGGAGAPAPVLTTVRVVDLGDKHLIAGATVFASDSKGELLETARTQEDGTVRLEVPDGGSITAAFAATYKYDGEPALVRSLSSAFQVEPGSTVTLVVSDFADLTSPPEPMHVTLTLKTSLPVNDRNWSGHVPCAASFSGKATSPLVLEDIPIVPCADETTFDIWALLTDDEGRPYAFSSDLGVPFTPGGTTERTLTVGDPNVNSARLNVTGIPAGSESLDFSVLAYLANRPTAPLDVDAHVRFPSVDETLQVGYPEAGFSQYVVWATVGVQSEPSQQIVLARTGAGVSLERNWPANRLARFEGPAVVERDEVGRPVASWKLLDSGTVGDAVVIDIAWEEASWRAFVPARRSGRVTLPTLPDSLQEFRPAAEAEFYPYAVHEDVADAADYVEFLGSAHNLSDGNFEYTDVK